jgi:hypothetical protein
MKYLYVKFSDATYRIPAEVIADNRAAYFATHDTSETTPHDDSEWLRIYHEEFAYTLNDEYEITDWASNNLNWEDVSASAIRIEDAPKPDYANEWINADKEVREVE